MSVNEFDEENPEWTDADFAAARLASDVLGREIATKLVGSQTGGILGAFRATYRSGSIPQGLRLSKAA